MASGPALCSRVAGRMPRGMSCLPPPHSVSCTRVTSRLSHGAIMGGWASSGRRGLFVTQSDGFGSGTWSAGGFDNQLEGRRRDFGQRPSVEMHSLLSKDGEGHNGRLDLSSLLWYINSKTKWVVSFAAAFVLLWRHDEMVAWCIVGSVLNSVFSKLLKRLLNQSRPDTAFGLKSDPGMPSSHAQSMGFLATYSVLIILASNGPSTQSIVMATSIVATSMFLSWLRTATGLHTPEQVVVGGFVGSLAAIGWGWLWEVVVSPAVQSDASRNFVRTGLACACGLAVAVFSSQAFRKWRRAGSV